MSGTNIVFAIGQDIVNRMKQYAGGECFDFVLGIRDGDYFEKNFISLEELDIASPDTFNFLMKHEKRIAALIESADVMAVHENQGVILFMDRGKTQKLLEIMDDISYRTYILYYDLFLIDHQMKQTDITLSDFVYQIDAMKRISMEAFYKNGSLLFCIDCEEAAKNSLMPQYGIQKDRALVRA